MLDREQKKTLVTIFSELGKYSFTAVVIGYFIADNEIGAWTFVGAITFSTICFVSAVALAKES